MWAVRERGVSVFTSSHYHSLKISNLRIYWSLKILAVVIPLLSVGSSYKESSMKAGTLWSIATSPVPGTESGQNRHSLDTC